MIVKLVEIKDSGRPTLGCNEVFVNTEHVVCVRPTTPVWPSSILMPEGVDHNTEYSKVFLDHGQNGIAITVVGPPALIESKINTAKRQLLKG